jgi:uncharacterized protein with GYD domain
MAKYLVSVNYSAAGAKGVRKEGGTKRRHVVTKALESMGGTLESFYFGLGSPDAVVIVNLPDNVSVAALAVAVAASGAGSVVTTPLLSPEEMDKACGKKTAYKAPGA